MPIPISSRDDYEFWLVWNPNGTRPPHYQHSSAKSAADEAERLAAENQGESFYVLHATEFRRTGHAPVEASVLLLRPDPDPIDDDCPF